METQDWFGLYRGAGWKGLVTDGTFAHAAKFPRQVIKHIYEYMFAEGWLYPGSEILDIFGGVALGALDAMRLGLRWTGVELESAATGGNNYVEVAQANIDLWNARYAGKLPGWGTARILQGDSRQLAEIIATADGICTSPPYIDTVNQSAGANDAEARIARKAAAGLDTTNAAVVGGPNSVLRKPQTYGVSPGQLGALPSGSFDATIASPPYVNSLSQGNAPDGYDYTRYGGGGNFAYPQTYGVSPGQLGVLPSGAWDAAVASPPYGDQAVHSGSDTPMRAGVAQDGKPRGGRTHYGYGASEGQIGAMRIGEGEADAVVTSPPYLPETDRRRPHGNKVAEVEAGKGNGFRSYYSTDSANLGNPAGVNIETFWGAARVILEQTYSVLRPGAVAAFMTGDFVRQKKRVPFTEQWLALCVAVGFEPLLWAKVWKTEDNGTQLDLFGGEKRLVTERIGPFRRKNNERNPEAAILNEDVLFVQKR